MGMQRMDHPDDSFPANAVRSDREANGDFVRYVGFRRLKGFDMSTDDETTMIRETVAKFVDRELIPLEPDYLKSRLPGSDHPELSDRATGAAAHGLEGSGLVGPRRA